MIGYIQRGYAGNCGEKQIAPSVFQMCGTWVDSCYTASCFALYIILDGIS